VVLIGLGLKRPVWAVVAYIILVYCKLSFYYPAFYAISAELVFALFILGRVFLSGDALQKLSFNYNPVNKYLFIFVLCLFLSFSIAWDYQYSWLKIYGFIKTLIIYVALLGSVRTEKDLTILIMGYLTVFVYLAYEPTYYFLSGAGGSQQIYGTNYIAEVGLLSGHVALANNMNQMIPIGYYLFLGIKKRALKIILLMTLVVFIIALIGSGSRGGVAGFMFFGLMVVYLSKKRAKSIAFVGLPLLLLLLTSGHLSSTSSRIDFDSFWGRFIGLTHGIGMLRKGNILGVGPGCYPLARGEYFSYTMESHNIYGQVIGDLGIPGTIVWSLFMFHIFKNLIAAKRKLEELGMHNHLLFFISQGIMVSLLVRLFISFGSHGLYYSYYYIVAAVSIAILKIVASEENLDGTRDSGNEGRLHSLSKN